MFLRCATEVEIGDYVYSIRNSASIYIKVNRLLNSDKLLDIDKMKAICKLVYIDDILPSVTAVEKYLRLFSKPTGGEPCFDLEQDKELIYAGFRQAYHIDLDKDDLSIEEFLALLKGLPEGTKFAEVIRIRTMPIPEPTKYNTKERHAIIRAKNAVALKKDNLKEGLRGLADMMRKWHG